MSWFEKLKSGLSKSANNITQGISDVVKKRKLDAGALLELEELLILSDMGSEAAGRIMEGFSKSRFGKDAEETEIKQALAEEIAKILSPCAKKLELHHKRPDVFVLVGVNGNGKTTTLGKLAAQHKSHGKKIVIAACDTFRAAAVEQLSVWGARAGCEVIKGEVNGDPASIAFRALEEAKKQDADLLLIDTAGRLQNKKGLMEELAKISRVLKKIDSAAPHEIILVLDATTGQNAHSQVEAFKEIVNISGIIITKLDGTAKGGVVVALAEKFKLPIYAVGVGEGIDDLNSFDAESFAKNLVGLNT